MLTTLGASLAQMLLSTPSTIAQERGDSYGLFGFTGTTIGVLVVIVIGLAVALAAICTLADRRRVSNLSQLIGVIGAIAVAVLVMLLLVTWWTQVNWSADPSGNTGFTIVIGSLAALAMAGGGIAFAFSILLDD